MSISGVGLGWAFDIIGDQPLYKYCLLNFPSLNCFLLCELDPKNHKLIYATVTGLCMYYAV